MMQLCSLYAKEKSCGKLFDELIILVRDWPHEEDPYSITHLVRLNVKLFYYDSRTALLLASPILGITKSGMKTNLTFRCNSFNKNVVFFLFV